MVFSYKAKLVALVVVIATCILYKHIWFEVYCTEKSKLYLNISGDYHKCKKICPERYYQYKWGIEECEKYFGIYQDRN
jgi:hypothetical protein